MELLQSSLKSKLFNTFGSTIEEFEANAEKLSFIGTITDFNIIKGLYNNSNIIYNERELLHLNELLNISREKEQSQIDKMTFSLKCIKQLSDFKNNQRFRGNELLQATYMSIFSRYNDNRDRSNNIFVSRAFLFISIKLLVNYWSNTSQTIIIFYIIFLKQISFWDYGY